MNPEHGKHSSLPEKIYPEDKEKLSFLMKTGPRPATKAVGKNSQAHLDRDPPQNESFSATEAHTAHPAPGGFRSSRVKSGQVTGQITDQVTGRVRSQVVQERTRASWSVLECTRASRSVPERARASWSVLECTRASRSVPRASPELPRACLEFPRVSPELLTASPELPRDRR